MNNTKQQVLCNSFSLQMVSEDNLPRVRLEKIEAPTQSELAAMLSAVGHPDTASVLGVAMNRTSVELTDENEIIVAQLIGGRLPEGASTLPEGASFKWVRAYLA